MVAAAAGRKKAPAPEVEPGPGPETDPDSLTQDVPYVDTRTPRDQKMTGPEVLERGGPEHPYVSRRSARQLPVQPNAGAHTSPLSVH